MINSEEFKKRIQLLPEKYLSSPSKQNFKDLQTEIGNLNQNHLDCFHSYILFPIVLKLEHLDGKQSELKVDLIQCISSIISRVRIQDFTAMRTMVILVLREIHNFDTGALQPNLSEEIQIAALTCIESIFKQSTSDLLQKFYVKESTMVLAKISLTCVTILQNEKYRSLKMASIKCLMASYYVHNEADFEDVVLRHDIANVVFLFLPKIILSLKQIATADDTQGHSLIALSVSALGRIVCLIFEDSKVTSNSDIPQLSDFAKLLLKPTEITRSDDEILDINRLSKESSEERFKKRQTEGRSDEWLLAASRKLKPAVLQMQILRVNQSEEVRREYNNMCCDILNKCPNNLKEIAPLVIESIIALSMDEHESIKMMSKKGFNSILNSREHVHFNSEIQNIFEEHLTRLPRIIHRAENNEQISEFLFLKGLFGLLPRNDLVQLFAIPGNLEKFCTCLISAFDMQLHNDLLNEEYAIRNIADDSLHVNSFSWKRFKHLNSERSILILEDICAILGSSPALNLIYDHLMELLYGKTNFSNEVILILTLLLCTNANSGTRNLLNSFVEEVLDEKHWHLALQADETTSEKNGSWFVDRTPGLYESALEVRTYDSCDDATNMIEDYVNVLDAQFNVLHTCIILHALGRCALIMEDTFKPHIFHCLHRVLLKSGSSNYMVYLSGTYALKCIKDGLHYSLTGQLIYAFTDYITFNMNMRLKQTTEYQSAVELLTVILRHSNMESMSHLDNIMYTLLNECSKCQHAQKLTSFLRVFHEFLAHMDRWSEGISNEMEYIAENDQTETNIYIDWIQILHQEEQIEDEFTEHGQNNVDNSDAMEDDSDPNENPMPSDPPKPELPKYIQITKDILNEILKFVSSKEQMHRIVSLECLITGLPLLRDYENELLPLVHSIWYPFTERFKDKDAVVLNRCFTLLDVLATLARDFILQRSIKDIIPILNKFLTTAAKNSERELNLTQTQEHKLQINLLQKYANLIKSMDIQVKEVDRICNAIIPYLNLKQPVSLQQNAVKFFTNLSEYNKPLVYVKLLKCCHLNNYKENVHTVFVNIGINK